MRITLHFRKFQKRFIAIKIRNVASIAMPSSYFTNSMIAAGVCLPILAAVFISYQTKFNIRTGEVMTEFISQGGVVMYILIATSLLSLTIIFERAWSLRASVVVPVKQIKAVEDAVRAGNADEALELCKGNNTAMSRILWVALKNRGVQRGVMKEILEEVGRQEVAHLERFVGILALTAAIAPLLGLLGTVIGMIEVFQVISVEGVGKADVLAGGISKALNTTAVGMAVAIPTLVAYRFFEAKVNQFVVDIEHNALYFVDLLKGERE